MPPWNPNGWTNNFEYSWWFFIIRAAPKPPPYSFQNACLALLPLPHPSVWLEAGNTERNLNGSGILSALGSGPIDYRGAA